MEILAKLKNLEDAELAFCCVSISTSDIELFTIQGEEFDGFRYVIKEGIPIPASALPGGIQPALELGGPYQGGYLVRLHFRDHTDKTYRITDAQYLVLLHLARGLKLQQHPLVNLLPVCEGSDNTLCQNISRLRGQLSPHGFSVVVSDGGPLYHLAVSEIRLAPCFEVLAEQRMFDLKLLEDIMGQFRLSGESAV